LTLGRANEDPLLTAPPTVSEIELPHTLVLERLRQLAENHGRAELRAKVRWRDASLTVRTVVARWFGARLDIMVAPSDGNTVALAMPRASASVSAVGALALISSFGVVVRSLRGTPPVTWTLITLLSGFAALWLLGRWHVRRDTPILLEAWHELRQEAAASRSPATPSVRQRLFGAGVFAEVLERGWMYRVLRIQTRSAVRTVQYVGFGAGWDGIDIDGELVAQDKSTWLRAQRLTFEVDGQVGLLVVRKWPWLAVRDLHLTLDGMEIYRG
jgi:hypothetical protein